MKKIVLLLFTYFSLHLCYSKSNQSRHELTKLTIGILQGGGGLIGMDFEHLISKNIGLSVGVGIRSYGASFHYHIKPDITSSSVAINYWHQGWGDSYVQSIVGPSYVFRLGRKFSGQLGIGGLVDKGPYYENAYNDIQKSDILLIYSLGMYF